MTLTDVTKRTESWILSGPYKSIGIRALDPAIVEIRRGVSEASSGYSFGDENRLIRGNRTHVAGFSTRRGKRQFGEISLPMFDAVALTAGSIPRGNASASALTPMCAD